MNDIDRSNDKYTTDSNAKYSNVKYANDSILSHILLFGKVSLDISVNTLMLTATMKYILSKRFQKSLFLVFCNFLLYFHLFNFFPYPYVFFFLRLYIHIHLVLRFAFVYLLTLFFYILFLVTLTLTLTLTLTVVYTQVILEYLRQLLIFCSICLYVRYSYIYKNLIII